MNPAVPIETLAVAVPAKLDVQGCLDEDISCRKCGYNLRGLSPDGRCPECGVAVGRSLQGDYLRFADPQWVQTLASGMNWIVAAIAIGIIVGAIAGGLIGGFGLNQIWMSFVQLGISMIGLVGYWKVTTPDPAGLEDPSKLTARKTVRITQVAGLLIGVASVAVRENWEALTLAVGLAGIAVAIVGLVAVFLYGRQLALRIPDDKSARHCRIIMWGLIILMIASFLMALAAGIASAPGILGAGGCVLGLAYLFFLLWTVRLIERLRKAFKEAARLAAATWAAAPLPAKTTGHA